MNEQASQQRVSTYLQGRDERGEKDLCTFWMCQSALIRLESNQHLTSVRPTVVKVFVYLVCQ